MFTSVLLGVLYWNLAAQPVIITNPLTSIDFDASGTPDLVYSGDARKTGDLPETWVIGFAIEPWRSSRFVRATSTRLQLLPGEIINSSRRPLTNYFPDPPRPPEENYLIQIIAYRAIKKADWEYSTAQTNFEGESQLLFGLRLALTTGTHYGWVRLSRPTVDSHTQFDLVDYAVHPVPNEPIPAGQPPPLPPIHTQVESAGLTFSWDARWGPLILESTTNLVPPLIWETVVEGSGDPVAVPTLDAQRFYRLRQP